MEKLIKIIAFRFAKLSNKQKSKFSDNFKIDYYLYQAILSDLSKVLIALVINLILGTLTEFLIILAVFGSLRFLTGGFHASSFNSCVVITLSLFTITPVIAKLLNDNINLNIVSLTVITLIFLLIDILYSPRFLVEVNKKEKIKYKVLSILYLILLYGYSILFRKYSIVIYMGALTQLITVTPIMYVISNKLKNKGDLKS